MIAGDVCPHETPGGSTRCAVCRVEGLVRDFGTEAERIERYGRIVRSRRETVEPAGVPMPERIRAEIEATLRGEVVQRSAPGQPALLGDEAEESGS